MNKIIFITLIIISYQSKINGQDNCRDLQEIVAELKEANYLKDTKIVTGFTTKTGIEIDSQYLRYEELDKCSSLEELEKLLLNESNIIVAYSWKSYLMRKPSDALSFLIKNIDNLEKREFREFLNHCQGSYFKSLANYMTYQLYWKIESSEIKLSDEEIASFNKLKRIREERNIRIKKPIKDF